MKTNKSTVGTELKRWRKRVDSALDEPRIDMQAIERTIDGARVDVTYLDGEKDFFWKRQLCYRGFGIAATLLLISVVGFFSFRSTHPSENTTPLIGRAELQDFARLYTEVEQLFSGQSVWMAGNGNSVQVSVTPLSVDASSPAAFVRLEVQQRNRQGRWASLWRRDILTPSSVWVDSQLKDHPKETVRVWAQQLEPDVWHLEYEVALPKPLLVHAQSDVLVDMQISGSREHSHSLGANLRLVQVLVPISSMLHEVGS